MSEKIDKRIILLKDAFSDTKTIISNLDAKARFLLAVNLAFIAGIFMTFRFLINGKIICVFQRYFLSFLILVGISIIIYNLYIIYLLITKVINPQNDPANKIKNQDIFLNESIFFPIPKNDLFDYSLYIKKLKNIYKPEKIYLFELLKISYIRHLKIKNLNAIVSSFEKLIIFLGIYIILICIYFILFF